MVIKYLPEIFEFPKEVCVCPICGGVVVAEFDEYETETGIVTETGLHLDCKDGPDEESDEYDDWFSTHWSMPYVDWLPLTERMHKWLARNGYRIDTRRRTQ